MSSTHVENDDHTTGYDARRLHTNDIEVGYSDAIQRHVKRNVVAPKPVTQRKLDFEHARPRWYVLLKFLNLSQTSPGT
jgi:hypothetical protein